MTVVGKPLRLELPISGCVVFVREARPATEWCSLQPESLGRDGASQIVQATFLTSARWYPPPQIVTGRRGESASGSWLVVIGSVGLHESPPDGVTFLADEQQSQSIRVTPYVLSDALWAAETEGSYYRFLIHVGDQDRPQEFGRVLSTQRHLTEPQRRGTQLPNGASQAGPSVGPAS